MDLLGSNIPSPGEVGLRLLLCPVGSNIVARTACCSVGIALPVYSTFKAIERNENDDQRKMLLYWAAYGSFTVAEIFTDKILYWVPLYYHMKFAFLMWLQLPSTDGAQKIYVRHLRPFFLRHQARLDQILGTCYAEAAKIIHSRQGEINFVKKVVVNIVEAAHQMGRDILHPTSRRSNQAEAIEGQREDAEDSDSGHEE